MANSLSLALFAARFGLSEQDLSYGIGNINGENIPVILVKNKGIFINILEDNLCPKEIPNLRITLKECTFCESSNEYIFKTPDSQIIFTHHEIEKFYASKYYSKSTETYIG